MISHKYKCIFIHIPKCAGTSIEEAFGIDTKNNLSKSNKMLFGWDSKNKLYLQHATPKQLLDKKILDLSIWNSYYKFIIVRNPYYRSVSSYNWLYNQGYKDSFYNYLTKKGKFEKILNNKNVIIYRGDHLIPQKEYFFLNSQMIDYDSIIKFEDIEKGLEKVIRDLNLNKDFFSKKKNYAKRKVNYSNYYTPKIKRLFDQLYENDIKFLGYLTEINYNFFKSNWFFINLKIDEIKIYLKNLLKWFLNKK